MADEPVEPLDITSVAIEDEMRRSYIDYAMSVIVSRALPDVRDGLKPVHRRILYAMHENGYHANRPYRKSARIVGDVMGKYHPHGDAAIYDAMVRMAQPFSMRLPLIDGQGNFGSMDGDKAAAMRYTEARLDRAAHSLLEDIDKETVDFVANYDETTEEPRVLPARYPNLLVNGAAGIAVGMATNIPPHNLGEVIDACCALIDDPKTSVEQLMQIVPGPDFPTGGVIMGRSGSRSAYLTGRGSVVMRGRCRIEEIRKDREAIIVSEMPYLTNKANMIEKIAELVREKKIEGISDIRDESDRDGVRVVVELRRDAQAEVVLNQLYRYTPLQGSFGVNMLALTAWGRPELLTLKDVIEAFILFREEVIRRRTAHELKKARERAHTLVGLAIAVANLDPVIALIRAAPDPQTARTGLMARAWPAADVAPLVALLDEPGRAVEDGRYRLSEAQARAILDLRLHRLTGLERDKIHQELKDIAEQIGEYLEILKSREKLYGILRQELVDIREQFATPRRTSIEEAEFETDVEDLIPREDMVVTFTKGGYAKRVPLGTYRAQRRGGRGRAGMAMKEEDIVTRLFVANTHTPVLFFSSSGMVYKLKVYKLPLGQPQTRGKALVNILPLDEGEWITAIMPLPEDEESWEQLHVVFATRAGNIRRNKLSDFTNVMANGKIAMKLDAGDRLIGVDTCTDRDDILLATRSGKCIRFPVDAVRVFAGRTSTGVRGIRLLGNDKVISLSILIHSDYDSDTREAYLRGGETLDSGLRAEMAAREQRLLTITENGFGKRSSTFEYRVTGRGGQGIANIETSARNGNVVASFPVEDDSQIMLITDQGKLIRMPVHDIRIAGRRTQGVTLFRMAEGERVVHAVFIAESEEDNLADAAEDDNGSDISDPQVSDVAEDTGNVDDPDDLGDAGGEASGEGGDA